jgi:hypothetical protein
MAEFTISQINKRIAADPDMQQLHKDDPTEFDAQVTQMYDSFGYNPEGVAHNKATKVAKSIEDVTGIPRGATKTAAALGVGMLSTAGGAALGSTAGPAGAVGGAMVGSLAGERINSVLGLNEEPTTGSDATALVGPLVPSMLKGTIGIAGKVARSVPGVGAALHQQAGANLDEALTKVRVTPKDVEVFSKLLDTVPDFKIQAPLLKQAVKDELDRASKSQIPNMPYIEKLNKLTAEWTNDPYISFKSLMSTQKDFNDLKEAAPTAIWKKLSGVLINDLDEAAQRGTLSQATRDKVAAGSQAYKNLIKVNRKMHAGTSLDNLVKTAYTEIDGDPNLVRFNKTAFMKKLNTGAEFDTTQVGSTFSSDEVNAIKSAVDEVGYLGWGPSGAAQSAGQYIGRSGAAGAIGFTLGGGSKGAMAGFAAAALLSHALESQPGRNLVKYMAKNGKGKLDMLELKNTLGKVLAGVSGGVAGINQPTEQLNIPIQE